jgi:hypothetical protein
MASCFSISGDSSAGDAADLELWGAGAVSRPGHGRTQLLEAEGVPSSQFDMIVGGGSTAPLFLEDPHVAANRRVTVMPVLRSGTASSGFQAVSDVARAAHRFAPRRNACAALHARRAPPKLPRLVSSLLLAGAAPAVYKPPRRCAVQSQIRLHGQCR